MQGDLDELDLSVPIPHVILDGDISPDRLDAYLLRRRVEDELDFKERVGNVGVGTSKEKLEFVKDAVAMVNTVGGYLLYGIADQRAEAPRFILTGLTEAEFGFFEPTLLKSLLERYVRRRVRLSSTVVESRRTLGTFYRVIYVERFSGGFVIPFESDGQSQDEASNRSHTVFSQGEIWVRRDAQTIRAQAEDVERLESDFRQREQGEWLNQHFELSRLIEEINALRQILNGLDHVGGEVSPTILPGSLLPTREVLLSGFNKLSDHSLICSPLKMMF
jgi:hypothetical protein